MSTLLLEIYIIHEASFIVLNLDGRIPLCSLPCLFYPIQNNHQYLHQHQPSQVQQFPLGQQSHPNYQVNSKSQLLHSKHQDLWTHSQQN